MDTTNMKYGNYVAKVMQRMVQRTVAMKNSYLLPELLAYVLTTEPNVHNILAKYIDVETAQKELLSYLSDCPTLKDGDKVMESEFYKTMMEQIVENANQLNHKTIMLSDVFTGMIELNGSFVECILSDVKDVKTFLREVDDLELHYHNESLLFVEPELTSSQGQPVPPTTTSTQTTTSNNGKKSIPFTTYLNDIETPPVIGRQDVIERTIQILARANKNNPIHVGEPGVGKTTIVDGLVKMIKDGTVPDCLKNAKVYSLNVGEIIAGTQFRGDLEKRVNNVLTLLSKEENPILYIDEIHNIVGGGTSSDSMNISGLLKPYLTTGKIKFIGATTNDEFKKIFSKDKAIARRFQKIVVNEPSVSETIEILKGLKEYYENFHHVTYKDDAIIAAVELSAKYVTDRCLPDKAIDLMDEAGAYLRTYGTGNVVKKTLIEDVLSKTCNIPKVTVEKDEVSKLKILDKEIKKNLFGQDEAVNKIVDAIKISRAGLMDENKPIASLLMVGPTGVGKTELAKTLANTLGIGFVKFDMSEYMDKTSVNKLIGASAGYVGY